MRSLYSNLISYWPLHEASSNRLDLVGQTNALAPTNAPTGAAGIIENSTLFALASAQRLSIASNANVQTGDIDFTFCTWVLLTTKPASVFAWIIKYSAAAGNYEYQLYWDNTTDRFKFVVCRATDSAQTVTANTFGAPSTATWYFISAWHDATADTVNIELNAGVTDSAATGGALQAAGTAELSFGGFSGGLSLVNGQMCETGFWKRVLTRQERAWLYNDGRGRTYPFDRRLNGDSQLGRDSRERRNRVVGLVT